MAFWVIGGVICRCSVRVQIRLPNHNSDELEDNVYPQRGVKLVVT